MRAYDGTVSIVQPLIAPLYGGRTIHEAINALSATPEKAPYDLVRAHWLKQIAPAAEEPTPAFESAWRRWLHDGVVPDTAFKPRTPALNAAAIAEQSSTARAAEPRGFDLAFKLDPSILDGRFANNGWLQELPKPITHLTWDNAVIVSPATAERLEAGGRPAFRGGEHGQIVSDLVELRFNGRTVTGAVFPIAGHPDDCATVHLGYGRRRGGRVAMGAGFDVNAVRNADALWSGDGLEIVPTGDEYSLACTQYHHLMEGRGMVRAVTREEFVKDPKSIHEGFETPPRTLTLYPEFKYEGYKWGMAIDVNACTGCNACVVSCQSENNIPVVGKDQVLRGREMHWLRVDSYYRGEAYQSRDLLPARAVHAVRERPVRGRLSGGRDGAQRRRPERHGLQPLHRHAVLLEQLPVQGPPLQLPPVPGLEHAKPEARTKSRRDGPQPRRHGEVHLLRAADQRSEDRRREGRPAGPGR